MKLLSSFTKSNKIIVIIACLLAFVVIITAIILINRPQPTALLAPTPQPTQRSEKDTGKHENKTATDHQVNQAHDSHSSVKKEDVRPAENTVSFGSMSISPNKASVWYSVPIINSKPDGVCVASVSSINSAPVESRTPIKNGSCSESIHSTSFTPGTEWTMTLTYQDSGARITIKKLFSVK